MHPHAQKLLGSQRQPNESNQICCGGCHETAAVPFTLQIRVHCLLKSAASLQTLRAVRGRPYFRYVTALPVVMMGLVDYSSDDEVSDAIDRRREVQQSTGTSPGVASAAPAHLAPVIQSAQPAATSSTPAVILPDAASLFSSKLDSRWPR